MIEAKKQLENVRCLIGRSEFDLKQGVLFPTKFANLILNYLKIPPIGTL